MFYVVGAFLGWACLVGMLMKMKDGKLLISKTKYVIEKFCLWT